MKNSKLVNRILFIIFLTNIPAFLTLLVFFKEGLSWILGSLISGINFWWMSREARKQFRLHQNQARLKGFKSFYFRYLVLVVYAVLVVILIKPNILVFGLGMLSAQLAIYINAAFQAIRTNKYFKE
ncbi:MAG: ATP synthase subunit I [Candidatus Cloacimonadota bacterium]|nr:ATP synthase subunit I [Candidatus Cloacimonadota bacterium]